MAEQEAWKISKKNKGKINLTVLRPGLIIDERLTSRESFGNKVLMKGAFNIPIGINYNLGLVSAFDVAKTCIKSLELPEISRNKTYFLVENSYYLSDIIRILKDEFERYGYLFYRFYIPNFLFWFGSKFFKSFDFIYHKLSQVDLFDNDLVKKDLKISFENHRQYILRTSYCMIKNNEVRNKFK